MADNVQFQSTQLATPASGTQVSTDEAASGHIQRVKLTYSADGADTHIPADANGLLVNLGTKEDEVGNNILGTDIGITTKSVVFGLNSGGGGSYEPVKVTPSGALTVEATIEDGGNSITVDGTVAATQSGTWNINNVAGTVSLPTGAATETTLATANSNLLVVAGSIDNGVQAVGLRQKRISVTPTISTSIYATGDAVGGLMTFSNAARVPGGTITINSAVIIDLDKELAPLEIVLFDRTFTATSDNATFDPTDADLANCIGVIKVGDYASFNDNAVAVRTGIGLSAKLNGNDLFGQLVVRSGPTYASTSDIIVILEIIQD